MKDEAQITLGLERLMKTLNDRNYKGAIREFVSLMVLSGAKFEEMSGVLLVGEHAAGLSGACNDYVAQRDLEGWARKEDGTPCDEIDFSGTPGAERWG